MDTFEIPADPYSTEDLDRAADHVFRTALPAFVKQTLGAKLDEMRSRADDPGYFGAARFNLPAEILELPLAESPRPTVHADVERCSHSEFDQDTRQVLRCVCRSGHLDRHLLSTHRLTP